MAIITTEPYPTKPVGPVQPPVWDPHCPACLSGFGPPVDPSGPVVIISEPPRSAF